MFVPPSENPSTVAAARSKIWRSIRWASVLFLVAIICWSLSDPWGAYNFQLWLELAGVLLGAGAFALIIAAVVSYRRKRSESLFPEDCIAEPKSPVLWSEGNPKDLNERP